MAPLKPPTADFYADEDVQLVRSACLTLATYLGPFLDDLVVVGGLVPTLLIERPDSGRERHVGTKDLDLGLHLAILRESRYAELVAHLQSASFEPDKTGQGKPAGHRWKHQTDKVTVDFLIAPTDASQIPGHDKVITTDLSAVFTAGLPLAFRNRLKISLSTKTLRGEDATRDIWVSGPGAFVALKALAFRSRGENKDAYDLLYVLQNYGENYIVDVARALTTLLDDEVARSAIEILRADFSTPTSTGPMRAAEFLKRSNDAKYRADLAGAVRELLRNVD